MSTFSGNVRRNASNIAIVTVMIAAGTILYIQALATSQLQRQVAQQQQIIQQVKDLSVQLNARAGERTQQIDQLNRHLDCIVVFFSEPNHTEESIADIDTCTIQNQATGQKYVPNGILSGDVNSTPSSTSQDSTGSSSTSKTATPQTTSTPQTSVPAIKTPTATPQTSTTAPKQDWFQQNIVTPVQDFLNTIF